MHVVKRLLIAVAGYLASVIAFFLILALIFHVTALAVEDAGAWTIAGVSPILAFGAPWAALFLVVSALVLSAIPMAIAVLLTELLSWRSPWIYMIPSAILAAGVYLYLSPRTTFGISPIAAAETAIFAAAGIGAAVVYWAIAGRNAGFKAVAAAR